MDIQIAVMALHNLELLLAIYQEAGFSSLPSLPWNMKKMLTFGFVLNMGGVCGNVALAVLGMWVGLIATCPWPFLLLISICFLFHLVKNWLLSNTGSGKHPDEEGTVMLKKLGITFATFCEVSANVGWASMGAMLGSIPKTASEVNH